MFYEVIVAKSFSNQSILTYSSPTPLSPGQIIKVPLRNSSSLAVVLKSIKKVEFSTKPILETLPLPPLPPHLLHTISWLSNYYLIPAGKILSLLLPSSPHLLTSNPSLTKPKFLSNASNIPLNSAQITALNFIKNTPTHTKLLHGITGSGKTNLYLKLTQDAIKNNQSTIILVPEIGLTSQLVSIFTANFGNNITLIHSKQTPKQRREIWQKNLLSTSPEIIIGPRSALFAPLKNLGLIIIDEAHDQSYFQENTPKYSALRLASAIANFKKIPCLLGTATPNLSDFQLAKTNRSLISLDTHAKPQTTTITTSIIDLKDRTSFTKNRYFSDPLLASIVTNLKHHHQTLIFHNRRGSAPITLCEQCGHQLICPTCYIPLVLHSDNFSLHCHSCGYNISVPNHCPSCHSPGNIIHKGFGTKLLETELQKLFPAANIARFDADNKPNQSLAARFTELKAGTIDLIIGTQSIAKGLDLPFLATVGIVQADAGLSLPDFTSEERTFQLITQTIGRIGRGHLPHANAIIQTYQPHHPAITTAIKQDYLSFANYLLPLRKQAKLPPFYFLAKLSLSYKTEKSTIKNLQTVYQILKQNPHLIVLPPTPAFHERKQNTYTWQLIAKSTSRNHLINAVNSLPKNPHLHFTIDPPSLLI